MKIDKDARYSNDHEWVRKEGDLYVYGITDHAQSSLGDITYVEVPAKGKVVVKAKSDIMGTKLGKGIDIELVGVNEAGKSRLTLFGKWAALDLPGDRALLVLFGVVFEKLRLKP